MTATENATARTTICGTCYGNHDATERHDCTDPAQAGYVVPAAACPASMYVTDRGWAVCTDVAGHSGSHTGSNGRSWTA